MVFSPRLKHNVCLWTLESGLLIVLWEFVRGKNQVGCDRTRVVCACPECEDSIKQTEWLTTRLKIGKWSHVAICDVFPAEIECDWNFESISIIYPRTSSQSERVITPWRTDGRPHMRTHAHPHPPTSTLWLGLALLNREPRPPAI